MVALPPARRLSSGVLGYALEQPGVAQRGGSPPSFDPSTLVGHQREDHTCPRCSGAPSVRPVEWVGVASIAGCLCAPLSSVYLCVPLCVGSWRCVPVCLVPVCLYVPVRACPCVCACACIRESEFVCGSIWRVSILAFCRRPHLSARRAHRRKAWWIGRCERRARGW